MGPTGVILGTLYEENGQISLTVHFEGFGPVAKEADIFQEKDERARFPVTEEMHAMLFEPGPNYALKADDIPEEPGVFKSGLEAGVPSCTSCPMPGFSDAARAAKFHGTVLLSIVVTTEGRATSIYVLKGAPFGLTTRAIEAAQHWRFEPGLKDGNPVPVRVQVETTLIEPKLRSSRAFPFPKVDRGQHRIASKKFWPRMPKQRPIDGFGPSSVQNRPL